jgi:membrane protein implicated in regulation of membrane protease activity
LPVRVGLVTMLGRIVPAQERVDLHGGQVLVEGESWNAVGEVVIERDLPVKITAIEGLSLKAIPKTQ